MIDLLATDKSRDFPQPRPIIVNYSMAEPRARKLIKRILHVLSVFKLGTKPTRLAWDQTPQWGIKRLSLFIGRGVKQQKLKPSPVPSLR